VLDRLHLPREQCHLVAVNGVHQEAGQLDARELAPDDVLAVWPPVAGG
jgi:molybdopterin converting factor small subunit